MYKYENGYFVGLYRAYTQYFMHVAFKIFPPKLFPYKRSN